MTARRYLILLPHIQPRRALLLGSLALGNAFLFILFQNLLPPDPNWLSFYNAGRAVLELHNPYAVNGFFNPPWLLLLLTPLSALPSGLAHALLMLGAFVCIPLVARRLGASVLAATALALSIPALDGLHQVNIDGIVLLGLLVPPQWGLFLLLLKPQIGAAMVPFYLVESWHRGGWKEIVPTFLPLALVSLISFAIFGNWLGGTGNLRDAFWNNSLFPYSIPVGLALFVHSIEKRDWRFALPASPCLSPYVGLSSWSCALLPLLKNDRLMVAASVGTWLFMLAQWLTVAR